MGFVDIIYDAEDRVADFYVVKMVRATAYLLLSQNPRFVVCEIDEVNVEKFFPKLRFSRDKYSALKEILPLMKIFATLPEYS